MGKGGNIQRVGARMLRRRNLSCWMTVNDEAVRRVRRELSQSKKGVRSYQRVQIFSSKIHSLS